MAIEPIDWSGAWTLEDYVVALFEAKKTDSDEFKTLLRIYGRPRLVAIWNHYRHRNTLPDAQEGTKVEKEEGW